MQKRINDLESMVLKLVPKHDAGFEQASQQMYTPTSVDDNDITGINGHISTEGGRTSYISSAHWEAILSEVRSSSTYGLRWRCGSLRCGAVNSC